MYSVDDVISDLVLQHRAEYDPVKAREYYLRTRELKGRKKGSSVDLSTATVIGGTNKISDVNAKIKNLDKNMAVVNRVLANPKNYSAKTVADARNLKQIIARVRDKLAQRASKPLAKKVVAKKVVAKAPTEKPKKSKKTKKPKKDKVLSKRASSSSQKESKEPRAPKEIKAPRSAKTSKVSAVDEPEESASERAAKQRRYEKELVKIKRAIDNLKSAEDLLNDPAFSRGEIVEQTKKIRAFIVEIRTQTMKDFEKAVAELKDSN